MTAYVLLQDEPDHVSIEWLLSMVEKKIERSGQMGGTFLIDLLPNMRYLLRIPSLTKNCSSAMQNFESKVSAFVV